MPSLVISDTLALPLLLFQRAIRQFLFQAQEVVAGLGHINVDRIKLLHGCQRSRLTVLYQCAFRHV